MGKKFGKIHRYLKVSAILAGIAGILLSLFRFLPREDIPARISPEGLNQTEITARFLESEGVLAVLPDARGLENAEQAEALIILPETVQTVR